MSKKDALRHSWESNAENWTEAVRRGAITSRVEGTDQAIIKAVLAHGPKRLLDVGCGEGWLTRQLAAETGCDTFGIDASPSLISKAREAHERGHYDVISYEALSEGALQSEPPFDAVIFNFALLDESISPLLRAAAGHLAPKGSLFIQTLHPSALPPGTQDGWQQEDFSAFEGSDWTPMPWYFRTLKKWQEDIAAAELVLKKTEEPTDKNGSPLSLLFTCSL